jgi:hypothetical protein
MGTREDMEEITPEKPPAPLGYATPPHRERGPGWAARFIARLSKPMPLGTLYLIMFALSTIATILVIVVLAIKGALR